MLIDFLYASADSFEDLWMTADRNVALSGLRGDNGATAVAPVVVVVACALLWLSASSFCLALYTQLLLEERYTLVPMEGWARGRGVLLAMVCPASWPSGIAGLRGSFAPAGYRKLVREDGEGLGGTFGDVLPTGDASPSLLMMGTGLGSRNIQTGDAQKEDPVSSEGRAGRSSVKFT